MTPKADPREAPSFNAAKAPDVSRFGVVDVGSNSVRLVIFDGEARSPAYFFNEKVLCGLGKGLGESGTLNPEGKQRALVAIRRFQRIAEGLGITPLRAVATAAMREADDGPTFRDQILQDTGLEIEIIDGSEEARLAAQGVLLGWPRATGYVCDIGGSSMEFAHLNKGQIGWRDTSPLGPLELAKLGGDTDKVDDLVTQHLTRLRAKMPEAPDQLYLVGGSWRAIAKLDMLRRGYPLPVLHEYRLSPSDLLETLDLIAASDPSALRKGSGISSGRMALVPLAAQVLRGVLRTYAPRHMLVSGYGLREGLLYEAMPETLRGADPLIEACRHAEQREARRQGQGRHLYDFVRPLFPDADNDRLRLIKAACLLHDVSWRTHPDYRAEVCFDYATRANLGGVSHSERIFLGLALLHRYKNSRGRSRFDQMQSLVTDADVAMADTLGRALRFGAMFTVGTSSHMGELRWDEEQRRLTLQLTPETEPLLGEAARQRFENLAKSMNATAVVRPG